MKNSNVKSIKEVIKNIRKYKTFLISAHVDPEGDSIGSQLAIAIMLKRMNKETAIINQDIAGDTYKFLPGIESIKTKLDKDFKYDAVCIVDCPIMDRIGRVKEYIRKGVPIINIDHHVSNARFGTVNWILPKASSTGEMVFELFKEAGIKLNRNAALNLYVAILMDTGSFRYTNTTYKTHEVISHLLRFNIDPKRISRLIYESHSFNSRKLLALMLSTIKRSFNGKIAWMILSDAMFKKTRTRQSDAEDFVNFALFIKEIEVALLFRQQSKGFVKVSLRSNGVIDVNKIAAYFGGGGHKLASGCLVKGPLKKVQRVVINMVKKELGRLS